MASFTIALLVNARKLRASNELYQAKIQLGQISTDYEQFELISSTSCQQLFFTYHH